MLENNEYKDLNALSLFLENFYIMTNQMCE